MYSLIADIFRDFLLENHLTYCLGQVPSVSANKLVGDKRRNRAFGITSRICTSAIL